MVDEYFVPIQRGDGSPATPTTSASAVSALATAINRAGFPIETPTFFPTDANQLTQADAGPPQESGPRIVDLTYASQQKITTAGVTRAAAVLFITEQQGKIHLQESAGTPVDRDASGYQLYGGAQKKPGVSAYTAIGDNSTITITFRGQLPTNKDVEKMLASMEVAKP